MQSDSAETRRIRRLKILHLAFVLCAGVLVGSLAAWSGYTTTPYGLIPALFLGAFCGFLGLMAAHLFIMAVVQFVGLFSYLRQSQRSSANLASENKQNADQTSLKRRRQLRSLHLTFVLGVGLLAGSLSIWSGYSTRPYGQDPFLCLGVFLYCGFLGLIVAHLGILAVIQIAELLRFLWHRRKRP